MKKMCNFELLQKIKELSEKIDDLEFEVALLKTKQQLQEQDMKRHQEFKERVKKLAEEFIKPNDVKFSNFFK